MAPLEDRKDFSRVCLGGGFLSMISGMVNVIAFYELSMLVSHHTGNASHVGRNLFADSVAAKFASVMAAYAVGAGVAGFCESDCDTFLAGKRSTGLLGSAGAVTAGALCQKVFGWKILAMLLFSLSQGIQNGVSTKFSSLPLRTTHMTGSLTDVGLILGQWARWKTRGSNGTSPVLRKPALFALCIGSFALGGLVARVLLAPLGVLAALVPAGLLGAVASGALPPHASVDQKADREKTKVDKGEKVREAKRVPDKKSD